MASTTSEVTGCLSSVNISAVLFMEFASELARIASWMRVAKTATSRFVRPP